MFGVTSSFLFHSAAASSPTGDFSSNASSSTGRRFKRVTKERQLTASETEAFATKKIAPFIKKIDKAMEPYEAWAKDQGQGKSKS